MNATRVLEADPRGQLQTLVGVIERAHEEWGQPVAVGAAWDRPARPFHVVLHCEPNERELLGRAFPQTAHEVCWPV